MRKVVLLVLFFVVSCPAFLAAQSYVCSVGDRQADIGVYLGTDGCQHYYLCLPGYGPAPAYASPVLYPWFFTSPKWPDKLVAWMQSNRIRGGATVCDIIAAAERPRAKPQPIEVRITETYVPTPVPVPPTYVYPYYYYYQQPSVTKTVRIQRY